MVIGFKARRTYLDWQTWDCQDLLLYIPCEHSGSKVEVAIGNQVHTTPQPPEWHIKCGQRNCKPMFVLTFLIVELSLLSHRLSSNYYSEFNKGGAAVNATSTFIERINQQANKLKAKWLLAPSIYHWREPNEALYTPEDRGMLLCITVICGWLSKLSASAKPSSKTVISHWVLWLHTLTRQPLLCIERSPKQAYLQ